MINFLVLLYYFNVVKKNIVHFVNIESERLQKLFFNPDFCKNTYVSTFLVSLRFWHSQSEQNLKSTIMPHVVVNSLFFIFLLVIFYLIPYFDFCQGLKIKLNSPNHYTIQKAIVPFVNAKGSGKKIAWLTVLFRGNFTRSFL